LGLVIDSCRSVKVPLNFEQDNDEKVRQFSTMISLSQAVAKQAAQTSQQIEKAESRCFPGKSAFGL